MKSNQEEIKRLSIDGLAHVLMCPDEYDDNFDKNKVCQKEIVLIAQKNGLNKSIKADMITLGGVKKMNKEQMPMKRIDKALTEGKRNELKDIIIEFVCPSQLGLPEEENCRHVYDANKCECCWNKEIRSKNNGDRR